MLNQRIKIKITLLCINICFAWQGSAQNEQKPGLTNPPVTISNSEQFSLFSVNTQQEYKIYVHLPTSYSTSDTTYPVMYGLDADIGFGSAAEMFTLLPVRNEMPELILVGTHMERILDRWGIIVREILHLPMSRNIPPAVEQKSSSVSSGMN